MQGNAVALQFANGVQQREEVEANNKQIGLLNLLK